LLKLIKWIIKFIVICLALAVAFVLFSNIVVIASTSGNIVTEDKAIELAADGNSGRTISVLGASVQNGEPSTILANRLDVGMELFHDGAGESIELTGDSGRADYYDEVSVMSSYIMKHADEFNIRNDDLLLDPEGYSTYASMYNLAKHNNDSLSSYRINSAIVVTQKYHLYRALYIAERYDLKVYGVVAPCVKTHQFKREIREVFARTKDFVCVLFKLPPEKVPDIDEFYT
jgi:vancomycin permeability regulator SanA